MIFRPYDISVLENCLYEVLCDPAKCAEMGQRALEMVNRWGVDATVAGVLEACEAKVPDFKSLGSPKTES